MKATVILILTLSVMTELRAEKARPFHQLCLENKDKLLILKVKNEVATIVSKNASDFDTGSDKHVSKVDLNKDRFMDYSMYLGGCGTGGCMQAMLLNCGDDKTYFPIIDPQYFSFAGNGLEVDKKNRNIFEKESWAQLKFLEYWQKNPRIITIGYRYQFDGKKYKLHFTPSEYLFLIKKAKEGRDFAVAQLFEVAYPRLKDSMKTSEYAEVRKSLLDPKFLKKIEKSTWYRPELLK